MWKNMPFEKCIQKTNVPHKLSKKKYLKSGKFPVVSQEATLISGYHNDLAHVFNISKPVVIFGDHTQVLKYVDFDFVVGADGVKILIPIEGIDTKYFYYLLQALMPKGKGYARHYKFLKELNLSFPPHTEQQRIAAKLDAAFAKIDCMLKSSQLKRDEVKSLPTKIVKKMLEDETYDWTSERLSTIAENLDAQRIPITKSKRIEGDIPYYGASGIVDYVENFIFDEELLLISEDGANLLARTYPIAFSIKGKTWVNNHAHVLKFDNKILQKWVEYYLNSTNIEAFISGMAQPKLNQKKLNEIPIPCPKPNLLPKLLSNLEQIAAQNEIIFELETQKTEQIKKLKSAILAQELRSEAA